MKEQEKLDEAKYFYQRMVAEQNNQTHFKYNLSAFISAARSVLEYAGKEINSRKNRSAKQAMKAWYYKKVTPDGILYFIGGERIRNFHHFPVNPLVNIALQPDDCFFGLTAGHIPLNGQVPVETSLPLAVVREKKLKPPPPLPKYKFTGWQGTEDVPTLCRKCLGELEQFIKEGVSLGYISG
jgi:hypothetical protein